MEFICQIDQFQCKYKISLDKFILIPLIIPDASRDIDYDRINQICEFQSAFYHVHQTFCFVGDIQLTLYENCLHIIDGLHRSVAMHKLCSLKPDYVVTMNIITSTPDFQMEDMLLLLNKSQQVPDYISCTVLNIPKRRMLDQLAHLIRNEYRIYISESPIPKRPNFNLNIFLTKMLNIEFLPMNPYVIMDYIKYINVNKWKDMDAENSKRCINKAVRNNKPALYITNDVDDIWCKNEDWWCQYTERFKQEDDIQPCKKKHRSLLQTAINNQNKNIS